jgi:hypothetical protein
LFYVQSSGSFSVLECEARSFFGVVLIWPVALAPGSVAAARSGEAQGANPGYVRKHGVTEPID